MCFKASMGTYFYIHIKWCKYRNSLCIKRILNTKYICLDLSTVLCYNLKSLIDFVT